MMNMIFPQQINNQQITPVPIIPQLRFPEINTRYVTKYASNNNLPNYNGTVTINYIITPKRRVQTGFQFYDITSGIWQQNPTLICSGLADFILDEDVFFLRYVGGDVANYVEINGEKTNTLGIIYSLGFNVTGATLTFSQSLNAINWPLSASTVDWYEVTYPSYLVNDNQVSAFVPAMWNPGPAERYIIDKMPTTISEACTLEFEIVNKYGEVLNINTIGSGKPWTILNIQITFYNIHNDNPGNSKFGLTYPQAHYLATRKRTFKSRR